VVDRALLASKVAAVRDAVARVREVLPPGVDSFQADRTAREIVVLNVFVALQECLSLATHWLADEGWSVPENYRDVFLSLGERDVLPRELAVRLGAASGFRNLVAHQYGVLDWRRVHEIASVHVDDLLLFCEALAAKASG
jgi:uncharacterized protein YutE (UPF0331/DUF86 family)